MKISTKGQYALEALLDMQVNGKEQESLKDIAQRRNISENYLEQIFSTLRKTGLVTSTRGAQGGYRLARNSDEITAGDIIRSVEGSLSPVKCICSEEQDIDRCARYDTCVTRTLWANIMWEINSCLDSITLEDLSQSCSRLSDEDTIEYYI